MLECVVNISEGRDASTLTALAQACGPQLLDLHSDPDHNRSVFTIAGPQAQDAARALTTAAVAALDITHHAGEHPRIGVVDVVPFVPVPGTSSGLFDAIHARDAFAAWIAEEHQIPAFLYGPGRSLPEVRRNAFKTITPDAGPSTPHATAGACAVGSRDVLLAYNLWLEGSDYDQAREIAAAIRGPAVRSLALRLGSSLQVSCNLIDPYAFGPGAAYDAVAHHSPIERAELVGLAPLSVLRAEPESRWEQLDLSESKTIEARLAAAGLNEGKV